MTCATKGSLLLLGTLLAAVASCRYGPSAIKQPSIDAKRAGKLAMETYDKNGDGKVAGDELDQAAALKAALPLLDTDHDGGVSAEEVTARVNAWKEMRTGTTYVQCRVTLNGQPLSGAEITFEPEPFLGEEIKPAVGTTTLQGNVTPFIRPEDRPDPKQPGGVHLGLYKVRISKLDNGKQIIPARFNTETTLGQEVSYDDPAIKSRNMVFALETEP